MSKTFRYQHLRTLNPGSEPSSTVIREGEIAVNLAKDYEKIFLKNTDDEIVKFIPEKQIDAKIAAQTGSTEAEITELTNSVNAISGAVGALDTKVNVVSGTSSAAFESIESHVIDTDIHVTDSDKLMWNSKQDALVSGTNIKTIQNNSLLGDGNIELGVGDLKTNGVTDFTIDGDIVILDAGTFF